MSKSRRRSPLSRLKKFVFEATGLPLNLVLKIVAISIIAIVGIAWTVLYTNADQDSKGSSIAATDSTRMTSEEKFKIVSVMPPDFSKRHAVERIDLVTSKIEVGEELSRSGGHFSERATDQLVLLYGVLCQLQDTEGISSEKTYVRLAELRQQALAEGNEDRVVSADYVRALSASKRLNRYSERVDFRFATDAVLNLDTQKMVNFKRVKNLYSTAINLQNTSSKQDSAAVFLSVLGDKLASSPTSEIVSLGLNLKDYPHYVRFYKMVESHANKTGEAKLQTYHELFAEIEESPPHTARTYKAIFRLLDKLMNKADASFALSLTDRLSKAASRMSPKIKASVDQSIKNFERRIGTLGNAVDLSGSDFVGKPLELPNDKPTTLIFWRFGNMESMNHVETIARSERFDTWETNVLVAGVTPLKEEQFLRAKAIVGKYRVLDNDTARTIADEIGIDLVPYHVTLDKDGKVVRLGRPKL